jgi:uncharacterized protein (DUF924 family)
MTAPIPPPESLERVVHFWREAGFDRWFKSDAEFDRVFREHFMGAHLAAARRELDAWLGSAQGCLALLILLDQFPRNAFRGCGHMYATDPLARHIARHVLERGFDQQLDHDMRAFVYLPFEHSEDLADQELSVKLFDALGGAFQPYAATHRDIIQRFGRFPHRNGELGRMTTAAARAFLEGGGFSG